MSDAVKGTPVVTRGLMPRHLRRKLEAAAAAPRQQQAPAPVAGGYDDRLDDIADDLRHRITGVDAERRGGGKPMLIAFAAFAVVAVMALGGILIAGGLAALLPDLDTSR